MRSAVGPAVAQQHIRCKSARRGPHQLRARWRRLAMLALSTSTFALFISPSDPVRADDGSLETQEGGLFYRKGWISSEISWRETARRRTSRRKRGARSRRSASRSNSANRRIARAVAERRDYTITRTANRDSTSTRVASLNPEMGLSNMITGPEISITRVAPRIKWSANRRCLAARLHATINHVARNYGRVQVNSTCRSARHNRRVGGVRRSYHIGGRAADIRVFGNIRAAARYLRRLSGGYKHYGGGLFHVDTGPRRTW